MNLRWARLPSWGLWWQLCVRQQWKVSTAPPVGHLPILHVHTNNFNIYTGPNSLCLLLCRTDDNTNCRVDTAIIQRRLPVLLKYLNSDTERQLQALYALQALIVALDQPPSRFIHNDTVTLSFLLLSEKMTLMFQSNILLMSPQGSFNSCSGEIRYSSFQLFRSIIKSMLPNT